MTEFVELYVAWVRSNPLVSAAIHFAILGTLGEHIPLFIKKRRFTSRYNPIQLVLTILGWALLGVVIKYGFAGMRGFVQALVDHGMLPALCGDGVARGVAVSVATNLFFGPQMMFFHRIEENLILRHWNTEGLTRAWWTLIWFWIPAHSITFSLPPDFQIGLAACWSVVLGFIMGSSYGGAVRA